MGENREWLLAGIRQEVKQQGTRPMFGVPTYVLTPFEVVGIVCDGDYWARGRYSGHQLRNDQHVIDAALLETMPWIPAKSSGEGK